MMNPCMEEVFDSFECCKNTENDCMHKSDNINYFELNYDDKPSCIVCSDNFFPVDIQVPTQNSDQSSTFGSETSGHLHMKGRRSDRLAKEWIKEENKGLQKEQLKEEKERLQKEQLNEESERLMEDKKKLERQTTIRESLRPYHLRLLKTLAFECRICKVTLFLQEGFVEFYGVEEDCEAARWKFLEFIQDLAEDSLQVSASISNILQSESGRCFMENLSKLYPACSLETEDDCVRCAAVEMREVQACLNNLRKKICQKIYKVQSIDQTNPKLSLLKARLEKDLLVRLTPNSQKGEVMVEGIDGDFDKACKDLELFNSQCQLSKKSFQINGSLQTKACKLWFNQELEQIKHAIRKEGGEIISDDTKANSYKLTYCCCQSQCAEIDKRLDDIRDAIAFTSFDLTSYFSTYTERVLVIHGLHQMGVEQFCLLQEKSFTQQGVDCVLSICLPSKYSLPKHRIYFGQTDLPSKSDGRTVHYKNHLKENPSPRSEEPNKSFAVTLGNTTINVKTGDITEEQTDVLVNVVGEDLNMNFTAVGATILKKYPSAGQLLKDARAKTAQSEVVVTRLPHSDPRGSSTLKTTFLIHVIIRTWSPDIVASKIKALVDGCLRETTNNRKSTIVFPPLGPGRRFRLPEDVVASAMVNGAMEYIQNNPLAIKNIIFVTYEAKMGALYKSYLEEWISKMDTTKQLSVLDLAGADEDDVGLEEDTNSISQATSPEFDKFEISVCTRSRSKLDQALDTLKKELKKTFVWQERVKDGNALKKLQPSVWADIEQKATKIGVVMNTIKKDGVQSELQVRGQQLGVTKLIAVIKDTLLEKLQDGDLRERRQSHRFPSYWKIFQKGQCEDADDFHNKGVESKKLQPVARDERAAIEQLIQTTWEAKFVGVGKDGVNLSHKNIKVLKIERLENPELWDRYCDGRKVLILHLKKSSAAQSSFTPVGDIAPNGPVKTSVLPTDSLLRRNVMEKVNECYLFHGFNIELKDILTKNGLDFRVANDGAMLGRGVYAAESATKSDQYADPKQDRTLGDKAMILMRVLLGEPYINTTYKDPPKFSRPPCKRCLLDKCTCQDSSHFDSVIDDAGRNFREFVVYDRNQCYPEYFITYQRV